MNTDMYKDAVSMYDGHIFSKTIYIDTNIDVVSMSIETKTSR